MESKQDWSQNNQAKSFASVKQCRSPRVQGLGENQGYLPLTRAEDIKAELSKDLSGSQLKVIAIKWAKEFPWGCARISALFCWAALLRVTKTSVTKTSVTHLSHPYVHLHFLRTIRLSAPDISWGSCKGHQAHQSLILRKHPLPHW